MIDQKSANYFRRRELVERAAAKNAASESARRVHQELAQNYAKLLSAVALETEGQPG